MVLAKLFEHNSETFVGCYPKKRIIFFFFPQREEKSPTILFKESFQEHSAQTWIATIKLMLISLMPMLMHKHVIEERMRGTKAILALDTADKEL